MVLGKRKRTTTKRSTYKRRRIARPRISKSLLGRISAIHNFRRQYQINVIAGNVAFAPYLNGQNFLLNGVPNASEFANLYDLYRINKIVMKFYLDIDPSAQTANTAYYPKLFTVVDHDDSNVPASLNELREHANCKLRVLSPTRPVSVVWTPSVLAIMFRTAVASTYSPKYKQWIDMANQDVPHYGLKFGIDNLTNTNYTVRQEVIMYFSCKHAR